MQKFFLLILVIGSAYLNAQSIETRIYDIIAPSSIGEDYIVLAQTGEAFGLGQNKISEIESAYSALRLGRTVLITTDSVVSSGLVDELDHESDEDALEEEIIPESLERSNIKNLKILPLESDFSGEDKSSHDFGVSLEGLSTGVKKVNKYIELEKRLEYLQSEEENFEHLTPLDNYRMSVLRDGNEVQRVFKSMKTLTRKRSQCYNRAHVWSYELYTDRRLNTGKIWIFFTRKYIRQYNYKWWFHVAPYTHVSGRPEAVVLDRQFTSGPRYETRWKNIFMKNNAACLETSSYNVYLANNFSKYCVIIKSSMFYWQPYTLKNLTQQGLVQSRFTRGSLRRAYQDGFKRRARRDI